MSGTLFVLDAPPYGTGRDHDGQGLAAALTERDGEGVEVFLIGDAATCAKPGPQTPNGDYDVERVVRSVARRGGEIGVSRACLEARGIGADDLADGARRSAPGELACRTRWADRVVVF